MLKGEKAMRRTIGRLTGGLGNYRYERLGGNRGGSGGSGSSGG